MKTVISATVFICGVALMACLGDIAYAAHYAEVMADAAPTVSPVAADYSTVWRVITLVAAVLSLASMALHLIAPRTKTKIDDDLAAKVDEVLAFIRGLGPAPKVAASNVMIPVIPVVKPPSGQSGKVSPRLMFALVLMAVIGGTAALVAGTGCGARQRVSDGLVGFLDCETADLSKDLLSEAIVVAKSAISKWVSGVGTIDTDGLASDLRPLKSNLLRCAMAGALVAMSSPTKPSPDSPQSAALTIDEVTAHNAFILARGKAGWPIVRVAGATL